ncbi:hypothetical protein [Streptomyces sp. NRRL F-2580]|uniref:hypothetical protein n=1 Tax=Streptomyces sp. NRRL F-2580 TaxID=1463841 RepID=UPI00068C566B|nr:hypothetical protein [Streptomyces sp. NRRL F-2580]
MTQRLDPGAGWYGEFLRRDPEGMRACLEGAAMPPWDVVESLLRDLAGARGAESAARETVYAAQLRTAAVTVWDRLPGGEEELRTLLAASAAQRADSETALRNLTARLAVSADPAETDALTRELSWTQDDVARAAARHEDLTARLAALRPGRPEPASPLSAVPRQRPVPAEQPHHTAAWSEAPDGWTEALPRRPRQAAERPEASAERSDPPGGQVRPEPGGAEATGGQARPAPGGADATGGHGAVGRAEGRWLRGGRRAGGARYAGSAAPEVPAFTPPPGQPADEDAPEPGGLGEEHGRPAPRGARFGPPQGPLPRGARFGRPRPEPVAPPRQAAPAAGGEAAPDSPAAAASSSTSTAAAGTARAVAGELLALRAQGRSGEAHALLCEAAAGPAETLPGLAAELARAGLVADWATLLWEAGSLPPARLAAAAAALGDAGREADCDALLRQGVARPAAEVADAALALGEAGRIREADALLGAFVRVRTAEEAAGLARRDPQWFAPRLLQAARALPGSRHRDLVHALRVAGFGAG